LVSSRAAFLASVRGAAAAAEEEAAAGSARRGVGAAVDREGSVPVLWRAIALCARACATAMRGVSAAVSGSFVWGRPFAVVAAGVDAAGTAVAPRTAHGGFGNWRRRRRDEDDEDSEDDDSDDDDSEDEDGGDAHAHPRSSRYSEYETVCFHAGAATAGSRHAVGVLAFRRGVPVKALAMEVPEGQEIVDAAPYTKGRVLVLCQPSGGANADPEAGPASVVMLGGGGGDGGGDGGDAFFSSRFVALEERRGGAKPPPGCAPASSVSSVAFYRGAPEDAEAMDAEDAATARPPRRRTLPGLEATAPLAVGLKKGLAAVLVGARRIALLDLEEDECDEDDESESEEGDDE
jgi:anaphase-promoting complex subunit 4